MGYPHVRRAMNRPTTSQVVFTLHHQNYWAVNEYRRMVCHAEKVLQNLESLIMTGSGVER